MKFSIITPTYNRAEKCRRAILSLQKQSYQNWEMILINDSPDDTSYEALHTLLTDPRIIYHTNETNKGVNFSRNKGLASVSNDNDWIIFLDDDDYLAEEALSELLKCIENNKEHSWIVTNRALIDGTSLTRFPNDNSTYSYAWEYLLLKRCKGDATHCIKKTTIGTSRFSKTVKQGEEWFFFYQIGLRSKMFYHSYNTTLTEGYAEDGLNTRKRNSHEQLKTLWKLTKEGNKVIKGVHFTFTLYILLRIFRTFIRN